MKQTVLVMLTIAMMAAFAACNSDRNNNGNADSLMTDSSVVDSTTTGTGMDTMGTDTMSTDSLTKDSM